MRADDLLAFTRHHYLHTVAARRDDLRHWPPITGSLMVIGLAVWQISPRSCGAIGVVTLGLFYGMTFPGLYRARIRKLPRDQVGLLGVHRLQISHRRLNVQTAAGKSLTYWHGIERIDSDSDYPFLYLSSVTAFVLARREFANTSRIRRFHCSNTAVFRSRRTGPMTRPHDSAP